MKMNQAYGQKAVGTSIEQYVRQLLAEGKTTANMTRDERHDWVVSEYPSGLNGIQFAALTLLSAGEDGIVDPPSLADGFKRQSMLLSLSWPEGLIERRCQRDEAGRYFLTPKALAYLETHTAKPSQSRHKHCASSY